MQTNGGHTVSTQRKHFLNPAMVPAGRKSTFVVQKTASTVKTKIEKENP
jgi:hypothetical protein